MSRKIDRRSFIKSGLAAGAAASFPYFAKPVRVFGDNVNPSEKITVASIGLNWMGMGNLNNFLGKKDVQVVAVCDVDDAHLKKAEDAVNSHYGNKDCKTYKDFRELLQRDDIDVIVQSCPDHWHGVISVMALDAGKDVYGEKPLTRTLKEGRAICDAVERNSSVWQTGSWQRSRHNFRHAAQIVRNGWIGEVKKVEVGLPSGYYARKDETLQKAPQGLDYDMWLGPAPYEPYCPARVHVNWRWHLDYGGGQLMDWVGHHVDIAHWGLGMDRTGPVKVEAEGTFPEKGLWNAPMTFKLKTKYKNGLEMTVAGGHPGIRGGTKWYGENGRWVWVTRNGFDANPKSLLTRNFKPDDVHLYKSDDHVGNFIDCVKTRQETITPAEVAHRSASVGHLGLISILTSRKINFDPETEKIIGDKKASRLLSRPMRGPWKI